MPTMYKIRDQFNRSSRFVGKESLARREAASDPNCIVEPLDYMYKWQLAQMLNEAYLEGEYDVFSRLD